MYEPYSTATQWTLLYHSTGNHSLKTHKLSAWQLYWVSPRARIMYTCMSYGRHNAVCCSRSARFQCVVSVATAHTLTSYIHQYSQFVVCVLLFIWRWWHCTMITLSLWFSVTFLQNKLDQFKTFGSNHSTSNQVNGFDPVKIILKETVQIALKCMIIFFVNRK